VSSAYGSFKGENFNSIYLIKIQKGFPDFGIFETTGIFKKIRFLKRDDKKAILRDVIDGIPLKFKFHEHR
jgi:hypothetical protein